MRIWNKATNEPWAMTESALQNLLEIAARENASPEVVAAKLGKELQNNFKAYQENEIAVIPVVGPLFRYANLMTQVSGASSYELIAKEFQLALSSPEIKAIILDIDSPGGEVNGCAELSDIIFKARGQKPIIAYASGDAASGAYWIASACDEIICSATSNIGSIGVVGVYRKEKEQNTKTIEIVSSQSPYKRVDPETDEGKAKLQQRVDDLASVFIETIARNRGVTPLQVESQYGKGDIFIGQKAVTTGLADKLGSFESVLSQFNQSPTVITQEKTTMDLETLKAEHSDLANELITEGQQQERQRIATIIGHEEASKRFSLAKHLAFNTFLPIEQAVEILGESPKEATETQPNSTGFEQAMAGMENPAIKPAQDSDNDDENVEVVVQRISSY